MDKLGEIIKGMNGWAKVIVIAFFCGVTYATLKSDVNADHEKLEAHLIEFKQQVKEFDDMKTNYRLIAQRLEQIERKLGTMDEKLDQIPRRK